MSTVLASPVTFIQQGAPHLIHTDEELAYYTRELFKLTALENPTDDEVEAIDLLTLLVKNYEDEKYPLPDADPIEVLRYLMQSHGLSQKDLTELGSKASASMILSGKRNLTIGHIQALSHRFAVPASVFL